MLALALLTGALVAQVPAYSVGEDEDPGVRRPRNANAGGSTGPSALFRLLPPGGAGAGSISDDVCTNYANELVGNYACIRGDTTQNSSAARTLTRTGGPFGEATTVCPSGTSCATVPTIRHQGGLGYWTKASGTIPAGDFSACIVARVEGTANRTLMGLTVFGTDTVIFNLQSSSPNGSPVFNVGAAGGSTQLNPGTVTAGANVWAHYCATYQYVANGTSVARLYFNGVEVAVSTTAVGPPNPTGGIGHLTMLGQRTTAHTGSYRSALYTEKVLSPSTIAAMAADVLPSLKGSAGQALTFARNSTAVCEASDGSVTHLSPHRPCWNGRGLAVRGAVTNIVLRSEELSLNTAWAPNGAAAAANTMLAPDGTMTADTLTDTAALGEHHVRHSTWARVSGTTYTASVYAKAGTKTWLVLQTQNGFFNYFNLGNGTAGTPWAGHTVTISPAGSGWYRCTATFVSAVSSDQHVTVGIADGDGLASYTGDGTGTLHAWGAQLHTGGAGARYVPTFGTGTTSSAEDVSIPNPISTGSSWAILTDLATERTGAGWTGARILYSLGSAGTNRAYLDATNGFAGCKSLDAAGAFKYLNATAGFVSDESVSGLGCSTSGLALATYLRGGAIASSSVQGTGTGIVSAQPNTLYLGSVAGSAHLNGYIRNFCVATVREACP